MECENLLYSLISIDDNSKWIKTPFKLICGICFHLISHSKMCTSCITSVKATHGLMYNLIH